MRIILLARHYPPAVSGGAKRPFLLAHALRQAGADVRVCAPSLPDGEPGWSVHHPNRDPSINAEPSRLSIRDLARDLLLWPDPDIRWSMRAAQTILQSGWAADWVISTSPPESIHVAGRWIAHRIGARWGADLRDLWLRAPHRHQRRRWHRRIGEKLLARHLLPKANLVTAVDSSVAAEATELGAHNVHILPHFTGGHLPPPAALPEDRVNIVHAGSVSLSDPEADIGLLLKPFEAAWRVNPALKLHLIGRLTVREQAEATRVQTGDAVSILGPRSLLEALAYIAAADGLALIGSAKMHVPPSKIVDYLQAGAPIVACGTGPWRADERLGGVASPEVIMASLVRGTRHPVDLNQPPTAADSATRLLALMRSVCA